MSEIQTLLQLVAKHFGWQVGDKIRTEINNVLSLENVDIQELQNRIKTIESILDADPDTEEFDVAQNIITQITNILTRLTNVENDVSDLKTRMSNVESKNQEQDGRLDNIENQLSNLASNDAISSLQQDVDNLETEVTNINNNLTDVTNRVDAIESGKADKSYVDETFVTKASITAVDAEALANVFRAAMDCGYAGTALDDCNTNSSSSSSTGSSNGSSDGSTGDGAVI